MRQRACATRPCDREKLGENRVGVVTTKAIKICITRGKSYHVRDNSSSKMVTFSARNTIIYKICKLRRAIFSVFYNISPPNFAILLILTFSF